ncbi:MAG: YeaH/YhbH family protein [Gammaproteobacteria bacterium]
MSQVIDRRLNGKNKSAVNRQRFIRRYKSQIKRAVGEAIAGRSITEIDKGEKVSIPAKDISEPVFGHAPAGRREAVHPGNREFVTGDQVKRPPAGGGQGAGASRETGGEDDFAFSLSQEEFLEFFFEDLALPDLVKTQLATITEHKSVRAGYTPDGIPANIDVVRSLKGALARRIALGAPHRRRLHEAEAELEDLQAGGEQGAAVEALEEEIAELRRRIDRIPFIDTFDLRYSNRVKQPKPSTQAVMFCLMDVSGSMDAERKDIAKRFFTLLYLFLSRNYERIDVVFIRHHTTAVEVDEHDFFYARETGGTVVSSALELMYSVIRERYPSSEWNIYGAQASDGDNWNDDSPLCRDLLLGKIMPCLQYYAYVEIVAEQPQNLWMEYEQVKAAYGNFAMQRIKGLEDIYPVFRELFKKQRT